MIPELTKLLIDSWGTLFPEINKPKKISYMGAFGSLEGATTTFLGFVDDKSLLPIFAVKVHRSQNTFDRFEAENTILDTASDLIPYNKSIPKKILARKIGNHHILVQSILPGIPMNAVMNDNGVPDLDNTETNFSSATNWIMGFHLATNHRTKEKSVLVSSFFLNNLNDFLKIFKLAQPEIEYIDQLKSKVDSIINQGLCIQHGDYCRHNILVTKNQDLSVIDWTFGKPHSIPLLDLFFFFTSYYLQVRKKTGLEGFLEAFSYSFFEANTYSSLIKKYILIYCKKLEIPINTIKDYFGLFLIDQIMQMTEQLKNCSSKHFSPRFAVFLASELNINKSEIHTAQIWFYFFQKFVANIDSFLL